MIFLDDSRLGVTFDKEMSPTSSLSRLKDLNFRVSAMFFISILQIFPVYHCKYL